MLRPVFLKMLSDYAKHLLLLSYSVEDLSYVKKGVEFSAMGLVLSRTELLVRK